MQHLGEDNRVIAGPRVPDRPRVSRSRVSNGSEFLPNIDGRSAPARRMRDIVEDLRHQLGNNLSPAQDAIVRRAATLAAWAEAQEAAHCTGEKPLDITSYTTAVNSLRRLLMD